MVVIVVVMVVVLRSRYKVERASKTLESNPKMRVLSSNSVEVDVTYVPGSSMANRKFQETQTSKPKRNIKTENNIEEILDTEPIPRANKKTKVKKKNTEPETKSNTKTENLVNIEQQLPDLSTAYENRNFDTEDSDVEV